MIIRVKRNVGCGSGSSDWVRGPNMMRGLASQFDFVYGDEATSVKFQAATENSALSGIYATTTALSSTSFLI
ncbi:hypothetical protein S83_031340 [Arachis hypogaea]|nr:uncharacterized protein DS421_10g293860 [Arachis hypogaea]